MRWHDNSSVVALPPRVVQPTRLNFRFTAADNRQVESDSDPALSPICGWIFYNPLDQALVLCDKQGQLAGELVIIEEQGRFRDLNADFKIEKGSIEVYAVGQATYILDAEVSRPKRQPNMQVIRTLMLDTKSVDKYASLRVRPNRILPNGEVEIDWAVWGVEKASRTGNRKDCR